MKNIFKSFFLVLLFTLFVGEKQIYADENLRPLSREDRVEFVGSRYACDNQEVYIYEIRIKKFTFYRRIAELDISVINGTIISHNENEDPDIIYDTLPNGPSQTIQLKEIIHGRIDYRQFIEVVWDDTSNLGITVFGFSTGFLPIMFTGSLNLWYGLPNRPASPVVPETWVGKPTKITSKYVSGVENYEWDITKGYIYNYGPGLSIDYMPTGDGKAIVWINAYNDCGMISNSTRFLVNKYGPFTSVEIIGPIYVHTSEFQNWIAGTEWGHPPFTYEWWMYQYHPDFDEPFHHFLGNEDNVSFYMPEGNILLKAIVTDFLGVEKIGYLNVFNLDDPNNPPSKKDQMLSDNSMPINEKSILIYPNPTNGQLSIEFKTIDEITPTKIHIYNSIGGLVYESKIFNSVNFYSIDLSFLKSGVYNLFIEYNNEKTFREKIFIIN